MGVGEGEKVVKMGPSSAHDGLLKAILAQIWSWYLSNQLPWSFSRDTHSKQDAQQYISIKVRNDNLSILRELLPLVYFGNESQM